MTQVLLINPPYVFKKDGTYMPERGLWKPLGILSLASVLKKEGISVEVIDLAPQRKTLDWIVNYTEKIRPSTVGISGTTPQIRGIVQLGEALKKKLDGKIKLVVGGPHVSADKNFLPAFPFFDISFVGEGEITFPEVVKKIINGKSAKGIICGKPPIDLDSLPFPERKLLDDGDYVGPYGRNCVTIHTTRGCPFRCLYCSSPVENRTKVRFRSPKSIIEEIEQCVKDYGTKYFIFTDDTFTIKQDRIFELCRLILKKGWKIKWNCETRANLIDEELLFLMKKAGCVEIFFGVESGSERIRREIIHKDISDKDFFKAFAVCRKLGIVTNAFLMAGFPTETRKELEETWDFCFKTEPDIIGVHLTSILPGSSLFEESVKEGRIKRTVWSDYARGRIKEQPVYVPNGLSLKDLENFQKTLYRKFFFRPSWLLRRARISFSSLDRFKEDVEIGGRLLQKGRMKSRSFKEEDYLEK